MSKSKKITIKVEKTDPKDLNKKSPEEWKKMKKSEIEHGLNRSNIDTSNKKEKRLKELDKAIRDYKKGRSKDED